jgi:hypothetical protein
MMHIIAGNVMHGWSDIVEERPANIVRQGHWQMKMPSKMDEGIETSLFWDLVNCSVPKKGLNNHWI